jgi:hypothetical protein
VTYYIGGQQLIPTERNPAMANWREKLFVYLARNAYWPAAFYGIPSDQVIELGIQVKIQDSLSGPGVFDEKKARNSAPLRIAGPVTSRRE